MIFCLDCRTPNFPLWLCMVCLIHCCSLEDWRSLDTSGANSALLSGITSELATAANDSGRTILQVHLYPADCSNVMNMMKALVTGFVDRECECDCCIVLLPSQILAQQEQDGNPRRWQVMTSTCCAPGTQSKKLNPALWSSYMNLRSSTPMWYQTSSVSVGTDRD